MGTAPISARITGRRYTIMRKERIRYKDIMFMRHPVDGFTLSYRAEDGRYFKQRYVFYGFRAAKRIFREYVNAKLQGEDFFT